MVEKHSCQRSGRRDYRLIARHKLQRDLIVKRENSPSSQGTFRILTMSGRRELDFLARAWRRANDNARRLGWIYGSLPDI